jgi:UDP-3-O-[3-hydroxymyristoyl] N-acetylglucosamine deacetylase
VNIRRTVARTIRIHGRGLHSGSPVTLRIHPYGEGIVFRCAGESVRAHPGNVTGTFRATTLGGISTVEHLMSAFAGASVTGALVELTAPELPGLDGSARGFADAIAGAGTSVLGPAPERVVAGPVTARDGLASIVIRPGTGRWTCTYDLGDRWPGALTVRATLPGEYGSAVAWARTCVLAEDIPAARRAGLGGGLDSGSVVIIGPGGYANPVRSPDEPARHKLLDLIGDLWLAGIPLDRMDVTAIRPGHTIGVRAAALLARGRPVRDSADAQALAQPAQLGATGLPA